MLECTVDRKVQKGMISIELTFYQWTLLYFLCFINKPVSVSTKGSLGMKFQHDKHRAVSKVWSSWTHWSECSRTCGGGVRMRSRHCRIRLSESTYSDDSCQGGSVEHELCSTMICSPNDKGFLEYQCSLRNGLVITGKKINDWHPYQYGANPCQLQCWSKDNSVVHSFGKVMDGTKCSNLNREEQAVCINGRCSLVDCSGRIGFFKQIDKCGICGGNNSTCVKFQNTVWRRPRSKEYYSNKNYHYEYDEAFHIPTGATNILVKEASKTNFLALADHKGNYFINGNWRVDSPGKFDIYGSEFTYNRTWDGSETLSSTTPTKYSLVVLIMGNGDVPTVHYEYWMPSNSPKQTTSQQHSSYQANPLEQRSYSSKSYEPLTNLLPTPTSKEMTASPKLQGYNSFYHRNEILKSVPSWSIKRFSNYKNPLNILSYQNPNYLYSVNGHTTETSYWHRDIATEITNDTVHQQVKSKDDAIWTDEIVPLDNVGRPTGTSAQIGNKNERFEYKVEEKDTKRHEFKNKSNAEKIINRRKEKSKDKTETKKNRNKRKRKSNNENCHPCLKAKHQTKHFCLSDFVLQAVVLSSEKQQENIRFEIEVTRSFKNKIPIMPREYIWSSSQCQCPKLGLGKELIIMGNTKTVGNQRESRLVVDDNSFVRKFTQKRARTMLRLIRDQNSICKRH